MTLSPSPLPADGICVLVVDDIEQNLLAMEALLARPGLRVLKAAGGVQALELLLEHDVALALLDVQMPEMDGFTLAELMRGAERTRNVPIIFVTAASQDQHRTFRGYEAGAVDFLHKPVDPQVLLGKVGVFVELCRQRRQLHERMEELQRVLKLNETMTAVLSHDLRTPLSAIALSAEFVRRRAPDDALRQAGERIRRSSARMGSMIDQLLDFSRIRSGVMRMEPRCGDLLAVSEAALAEVRQARPGARIELESEGDPRGEFDPDRMLQVLLNLVGNAVHHGDPAQPVRVELDGREPHRLALRVSNAGVVPEALRPELFQPFRSTPRQEGQGQGLGLGLYIVDQFVRAHGGTVRCRSCAAQGMTVFELELPRRAVPQPG